MERAREIRSSLGDPEVLMLGVDRLDYTKGIRHRLKAYEELLSERRIGPPEVTLVQVATPSRERVDAYRNLRNEIEQTVGRINGELGKIGSPAVHYLHHSYPREEMAALFQAADVMLVTPLRDGMNLVAKEYVTCRHDLGGALVLSEFTGAWHELHQAFACNPHDIEGLKQTILRAINTPAKDKQRIMRALRRRVSDHDVQRWAARYLAALDAAPDLPGPRPAGRRRQRPPRRPGRRPGRAAPRGHEHRREGHLRMTDGLPDLLEALEEAAASERLLVATDYDGVLARFAEDPMQATAEPGTIDTLRSLAELPGVHVAVVSGRDLDDAAPPHAASTRMSRSSSSAATAPNPPTRQCDRRWSTQP